MPFKQQNPGIQSTEEACLSLKGLAACQEHIILMLVIISGYSKPAYIGYRISWHNRRTGLNTQCKGPKVNASPDLREGAKMMKCSCSWLLQLVQLDVFIYISEHKHRNNNPLQAVEHIAQVLGHISIADFCARRANKHTHNCTITSAVKKLESLFKRLPQLNSNSSLSNN